MRTLRRPTAARRIVSTARRGAEPVRAAAEPRLAPQDRERREGGPRDRALYGCSCGSDFTAPVTASVACPECGCSQAW